MNLCLAAQTAQKENDVLVGISNKTNRNVDCKPINPIAVYSVQTSGLNSPHKAAHMFQEETML